VTVTRSLLLALCALALGIAGSAMPAAQSGKLTIFYNGKIFTSEGTGPPIEDGGVAVQGNSIVSVGSSESVLQLQAPDSELINLNGNVLLPGFNDAHVHPFDSFTFPQFGRGAVVVNDNTFLPGPGPSFEEVLAALQTAARVNPPGTWLMAFIGTGVLDNKSVDRLAIDRVSPNHPVLLSTWFGHGTFINTRAMQTLGFSATEPDPPGGFFGRFANGELNGEVREYAEHRIRRFFSEQMTDEQLVAAYEQFTRLAAQAGYTTIQEFAIGIPQSRHLEILRKANLPIRVRAHCFPLALDEPCDVPTDFTPERSFAMKYVGGNKWINDGTPIERLSLLRSDYEDDPGNVGRANFPDETVNAQFERAAGGRLAQRNQILIHQTGDGLADMLFDQQQKVRDSAAFWRQRRPRLEHGFVLQPEQIGTAAEWGWTVITNPIFYSLAEIWQARLAPVQEAAVWPTRSLIKSGVPVAIGSDASSVRGPFVDLFFAQINPSNPAEAISLEQALVAYTKGSAFAEFKEAVKGSLTELSLADLVVLDRDIFRLQNPADILATQVLLTMVNGTIVHEVPQTLRHATARR
jgi:predicted amidohydrolase YtcJ